MRCERLLFRNLEESLSVSITIQMYFSFSLDVCELEYSLERQGGTLAHSSDFEAHQNFCGDEAYIQRPPHLKVDYETLLVIVSTWEKRTLGASRAAPS